MISLILAMAIMPNDHYDKWIEFDRVVFQEVHRFKPQRFGFGLGNTQQVIKHVVFENKDIFGKYHVIQQEKVDKFPGFQRHGFSSIRFTITTAFWHHLGETYIWEWQRRPRRIQTRLLVHKIAHETEDAD